MTSVLYLERFCTCCKKRKSLVGGTSFPRFRCKECRNRVKRNNLPDAANTSSQASGVLVQQGIQNIKQP
jgi:hypothetical protein